MCTTKTAQAQKWASSKLWKLEVVDYLNFSIQK